jgi:hypothetical protein
VALVTYVGLALFLYAHVAFSGGARYPDCACGDQTQETWFLRWPLVSLTHGLDPFFTKFMNSPHGVNLAVNTSSPLLGLLSIPFQLTVGAAVTYDLFLPLSMAASAASLFFVLRRWVPSPWIRLAGGLLYGFSPYMIGQGHGHLFLTAAFVPPIVLLVLDNLLSGRRSSRWSGVALGALAVAQYLISPEVLAMTAVLGAVGLVVLAVANPRRVRAHLHRLAVGLAWAAVVAGALLAYPIWFALAGPQHISGPVHPIADLNRFSGDLLGAVVPTVSQHLAPAALKARGSALTAHSPVENGLYLGIPLIAVLIGLTVRFRRHRPLWFFGAMTVAAWLLALGARATVDRTRTSVPLPFAALLHVPLVNDIESARFSLFMALFAACWLSIGLARLAENRRARAPAHQRRSRRVEPATVVVGLVALVPLAPFGPFQGGPAPVPSFYTSAAAARIPWGSVALTYPYPTPATAQPLLDQAMAGLRYKVLGGYAFVPAVGGGSTLEPPLLPPPPPWGRESPRGRRRPPPQRR